MKQADRYISRIWKKAGAVWAPYREKSIAADEVSLTMARSSVPSFGFFFMLGLASAIATAGLIANSAPAIIGAMIIAPMMSPILSLSYGLVILDRSMIIRSIVTVATGTALVVAISFISSSLFGLRLTGSEIISRTSPTMLDLVVALAAGGAAAFSQTRRSIANSIAGVAIAVALVPPLAVSGIGLAVGEKATLESGIALTEFGSFGGGRDIAVGAFTLFLTNLLGIVIVAMLVFILERYGEWKKALLGLVAIVACSVLLVPQLHQTLRELYIKNRVVRLSVKLASTRPDIVSSQGKIDSLHVFYHNGTLHVYADVFSPRDGMKNLQSRLDEFRKILSAEIGEPVVLDVDMIPLDIVSVRSEPPEMRKFGTEAGDKHK